MRVGPRALFGSCVDGNQGGSVFANQEVKGVTVVTFPLSFTLSGRAFGITHGTYSEGVTKPVIANVSSNSEGTTNPNRGVANAWFTVRNNSGAATGSLWWLVIGK